MKYYKIKSSDGLEAYLKILRKVSGGYDTQMITYKNSTRREEEGFLTDDLFEICLRTEYLTEVETPAGEMVSA